MTTFSTNRPGPVTSDAPDDNIVEKQMAVLTGGISIPFWVDDESEVDEDGFLNVWRDKNREKAMLINTAHILYAYEC